MGTFFPAGLNLRQTKTSARREESWPRIRNTRSRKPSTCLTPTKIRLLTTMSWRWEMWTVTYRSVCRKQWDAEFPVLLSWQVAMRALGFEVKKVDVLKILKDYDREGNGKITFEDFSEVGEVLEIWFNTDQLRAGSNLITQEMQIASFR